MDKVLIDFGRERIQAVADAWGVTVEQAALALEGKEFMDKREENIKFILDYCDFSDPNVVWILKGVARNKDNNEPVKFFKRMVLASPNEVPDAYDQMVKAFVDPNTVYRMYVSLNGRDATKALFNFQKTLAELSYDVFRGVEDGLVRSKRIGSLWKTELEQKRNRATKRFLLDLDNCENDEIVGEVIDKIFTETSTENIHCDRITVSGYAIVFGACDTRALEKHLRDDMNVEYDIQKDSMLFVDIFNESD